jgi:hypothetical protein
MRTSHSHARVRQIIARPRPEDVVHQNEMKAESHLTIFRVFTSEASVPSASSTYSDVVAAAVTGVDNDGSLAYGCTLQRIIIAFSENKRERQGRQGRFEKLGGFLHAAPMFHVRAERRGSLQGERTPWTHHLFVKKFDKRRMETEKSQTVNLIAHQITLRSGWVSC